MKRKLSLILAVLFVLALFAGCGGSNSGTAGGNTSGGNTSGGNSSVGNAGIGSPSGEGGSEPVSPYQLAAGNFAKDAEGWPLEKYEYALPLSTTDEVFTNMTLSFTPQYLPEGGMGDMPMYAGMENLTGVHIEYHVLASSSFSETLSVAEASDDLDDILAGYWAYHSGSPLSQCIEDGFIINVKDYMDYCPNYCRWAKDYEWVEAMWGNVNLPSTDKWAAFMDFYDKPQQTTGYFMRGDWLDELGMDAYAADTFDDWYVQLKAVKTAGYCDYPLQIYSNIDAYANVWNAFNTTPYAAAASYTRVVNGKVEFTGTTEDDKTLLQYIKGWYDEGLISPNFQSVSSIDDINAELTNDMACGVFFNPSEIAGYESMSINPNCRYDCMKKLRVRVDENIHWHLDPDEFGGCGSSVSAKCENIPLVVSWIDWAYSPYGADYRNWGPQGVYWDYNEDGDRRWNSTMTDFEMGVGWATMCYLQNPMDSGINSTARNYAFDGGERLLHFFDIWNECIDYYDGIYNYPAAAKLSDEDSAEVNALRSDADTFFSENYVMFVTGEKSFAEWDAFQSQLADMGMARVTEIYQETYDAYMAAQA